MNTSLLPDALSEKELDELAEFLDSNLAPAEAMDISMLQGFLTALALASQPLSFEDWLPEVWGEEGDQPAFASPEHEARIKDLLRAFQTQTARILAGDLAYFTPILYVDEEAQLDIARPWCHGFTHGVWLQEDAWAPLLDDEESSALLEALFNCDDEEARAALEAEGENLLEWEDELAAAIPDIIAELSERLQRKP